MTFSQKKVNNKQGFVILFAMLISSLILLMTVGILNVVKKQVILSSYSSESQRAFYAADAALECALFEDLGQGSTQFLSNNDNYIPAKILCSGNDAIPTALNGTTSAGAYTAPYVFRYENKIIDSFDVGCAYVLVEKTGAIDLGVQTRITAVGFNVCDGAYPDVNDPTLLERRLSVRYDSQPPAL